MGIDFPAPLGLAAGFDKDAKGVEGMTMLGFGFIEIGTVTAKPQPGNPRPRLKRIRDRRALVNRMGFNNEGADVVAKRLKKLRDRIGTTLVIGVNIGKTKVVPERDAIDDYVYSATALAPYADYLVVNVSSPNTPGLRNLQAVTALRPLLLAVRHAANDAAGRHIPLLVKIAPDLDDADVDAVGQLANEIDLDGVVAVNTTIAHNYGQGGLSGPPELERGIAIVTRLRRILDPKRIIIGCGGITSVADAARYRRAGANLVQAYTAFIYEGPLWPSRINKGLAKQQNRAVL